MSDGTKIEWADATWNPITGCSVVSPGCTNCYAMRLAGTRLKHHPSRIGLTTMTKAGPVWTGEVRFNERVLDQPMRWRKPRRIFVCAHGDLLHEAVPDEWIDKVAAVMALSRTHQFLVLTKRPERALNHFSGAHGVRLVRDFVGREMRAIAGEDTYGVMWPLPQVWLGVSAEDQDRGDKRIPVLLATPAARRWVSVEPLLGPVTLNRGNFVYCPAHDFSGGFCLQNCGNWVMPDWVVVGGESGPNARPCKVEWVRSIVQQCQAARVPVFVKQLGSNCDIPLRHQKGGDPSEWPEDLRVRQWPSA